MIRLDPEIEIFHGVFWKPEDPAVHKSGILALSSDGKNSLQLVDGLVPNPLLSEFSRQPVLHGSIGSTEITLLDLCFDDYTVFPQISDTGEEKYSAKYCIRGQHLTEEDCKFDSIRFVVPGFDHWYETHPSAVTEAGVFIVFAVGHPNRVSVTSDEFDLSIFFTSDFEQSSRSIKLETFCKFEINFKSPRTIQEMLVVAETIQTLVSFAIEDHVAPLRKIEVWKNGSVDRSKENGLWVNCKTSFRADSLPDKFQKPRFSFDEIGGLDFVAMWIEYASKIYSIQSAVHLLNQEEIFIELKFINLCMAVESLYKFRHAEGGYKPKLKESLEEMLEILDTFDQSFAPYEMKDDWVELIQKTRNAFAHEITAESKLSLQDLYDLMQSLRVAFIAVLLILAGANSQAIRSLSESSFNRWVKTQCMALLGNRANAKDCRLREES